MRTRTHFPHLIQITCLFVLAFGCDSPGETKSSGPIEDFPLKSYQVELLDIAFQAASLMPANPHIKDRSRLQESVVKTYFELKQPQRALKCIEKIDNWRRGAAYADLALYYTQNGAMKESVEPYLNKAAQEAAKAEDWRRDRIRVKIAQARTLLGQHQQAKLFATDIVDSESGKVARTEVMTCKKDSFEKEMESLEKTISTGQFDVVKNALGVYAGFFNRFYEDVERRILIEEKVKAAWSPMPILVRIDLLIELTGFALAHSDQAKALALIDEAKTIMDSASWPTRFGIPLRTKLAELRFRAGDEMQARKEARDTLILFNAEGEKIVNIYRAQMLRSIAEAYWAMGDNAMALDLYKRAIEAGIENPNSRPRAEDLAATCCSMALHGVEPNVELISRIHKIRDNLGDPW